MTPIPHSNRVPRNDGQKTHNFRTVSRDSPATFYEADDGTDVAPLSANEYGVLAGVKSPGARYQIFLKKSKLDWGTKLKIGDQVSVELPPDRASAVVRYVGEVKTLPGITFGVEITVPYALSVFLVYYSVPSALTRTKIIWVGGLQMVYSRNISTSGAELTVPCLCH